MDQCLSAIPTGGASLVLYAVAGGLIVGTIFVAATYVLSGGQATFDDYVNAFALGFTIGAVIGGGVYAAFGVGGRAALATEGAAARAAATRAEARVGEAGLSRGLAAEERIALEAPDVVSKEGVAAQTALETGATARATGVAKNSLGGTQVAANAARGAKGEELVAAELREAGYDVTITRHQFYIDTPLGPRYPDLIVLKGGQQVGFVEVKTGASAYSWSQRAKDLWIEWRYGEDWATTLVRVP